MQMHDLFAVGNPFVKAAVHIKALELKKTNFVTFLRIMTLKTISRVQLIPNATLPVILTPERCGYAGTTSEYTRVPMPGWRVRLAAAVAVCLASSWRQFADCHPRSRLGTTVPSDRLVRSAVTLALFVNDNFVRCIILSG